MGFDSTNGEQRTPLLTEEASSDQEFAVPTESLIAGQQKAHIRKRLGESESGGAAANPDVASTETERVRSEIYHMRAFYASVRSYHLNIFWFQVLFMLAVGLAVGFFMIFHAAPPELLLRKMLFGYIFVPFYCTLFLLLIITRSRYEVNDVIARACLFAMGFGSAYVTLSLFNSIALALSMSQ